MENSRPVLVKRMPAVMDLRQSRDFLRDLQPLLVRDRPQLVFDLSQVERLDASGIEALLHCMSEAMKRDGDVKLASPTDHAAIVLELTRTDRLFEIYQTSTDAVRSFSSFLPNTLRHAQQIAQGSHLAQVPAAEPTKAA